MKNHRLLEGVICLEPVYDNDYGDVTRVYLECGDNYFDHRKTIYVLHHLARLNNISLEALKENYAHLIGRKKLIPVPLGWGNVLFAAKVRQPRVRGDSAFAFIRQQAVAKLVACEEEVEIVFNSGVTLTCLERKTTVSRRINQAQVLLKLYTQQALTRRRVYMVCEDPPDFDGGKYGD